ncbi:MAG: CT253 family lipoprotein [Chlamydiota bacterium]
MKRLTGWMISFCFFCCGCTQNVYDQESRFHNDGRAKPMITLIPVFDMSEAKTGWSLSEEFTDHLRQRLLKTNRFYLNTPEEINPIITQLTPENNPFSTHPDWIDETFAEREFVVFTEIVEHDIHPKQVANRFFDKLTPSSELTLTMRIRVFDLRKSQRRVILEELISHNYLVSNPKGLPEKSPDYWQKISFTVSPLGMAHAQLAKEVTKRVEDYILLAQSR